MPETGELKLPDEYGTRQRVKEPHYISSRLLEALGGTKESTPAGNLVSKGAYFWGVEDREMGGGILNHSLLTSRTAYHLAKDLKESEIEGYKDVDLQRVVEAAVLHDITKLYGENREKLPVELKKALGLPENFREISEEVDQVGISWLRELVFPPEVYEAIRGHDFPEKIIDNPYWKIVLVSDYMAGQRIMTVEERLTDVQTRWIDERVVKGEEPRIDPERFTLAQQNIYTVAREIFGALRVTDKEFINKHKLNELQSLTRWERFLTKTREQGREERAKHLVSKFIKEEISDK